MESNCVRDEYLFYLWTNDKRARVRGRPGERRKIQFCLKSQSAHSEEMWYWIPGLYPECSRTR